MSTIKKLMMTAAGGAEALAIEDVFSTYLYTGNGTSQTITNGIDLAGEGGLVWQKSRSLSQGSTLTDTERGSNFVIQTETNAAQVDTGSTYVSSFNPNGFSIGLGNNSSGATYASWTFRKAPRFFDVVTYTGNGVSGRAISHNLGSTPAVVVIKSTSSSQNWVVRHEAQITEAGSGAYFVLNSNASGANDSTVFSTTSPTSTNFYVGDNITTNSSGVTYVAYLFANNNNDGEFGPTGDQDIIKCGVYTGNGTSSGPVINLGWEPQWILLKASQSSTDWNLFDSMRELTADGFRWLKANSFAAESSFLNWLKINSTGFQPIDNSAQVNASGIKYYYIAIRRGPMRQPTSGTEVFKPSYGLSASNSEIVNAGFPIDLNWRENVTGGFNVFLQDRMRGFDNFLSSNTTSAEAGAGGSYSGTQNGILLSATLDFSNWINWSFRRAPGFFDVVGYTGNGVAGRTVPHNLGVAPEMMIVKKRSGGDAWPVYHTGIPRTAFDIVDYLTLNTTSAAGTLASPNVVWNNTEPSATVFTLGLGGLVNESPATYIAYLFATLPGVSKVGSYTGNGSSQTINCGFTSGARFIIIKRTDSTGDWYVWDTARGIVTGNDPHLSLNTTAAEVTTDDSVDPASTGFIVNQVAATNINVSSASYIFYAIA